MNSVQIISLARSSLVVPITVASITLLATIKFLLYIKKRREGLKIFDECNIAKIGNERPFIGNVLDTFARYDSLQLLDSYHKKLGKSFGLFYGPDPWVMSVDLELIQRVFITEGHIHTDQTDFRLPFVTEFNESLAQVKGDKWRYNRRIIGPSFSHRQMQTDNVFQEINRVCELMLDYIAGHRSPGDQSAIVDVHYGFKKYSLETIFRIAYGCEYKERLVPGERDELIDWLEHASTMISGTVTFLSISFGLAQLALGSLAGLTPLGACIRYIHSITSDSLKKRRELLKERGGKLALDERKMIDSLIESSKLGKMSDANLRANLFFMLLAGYETSSSALALMCWYLAWHQEAQEKLRKSIVAEGEESEYLDWCIKETIRLWPPVPTSIGRVLEHDIEYNGQRFVKGMSINASVWSIHRWPEYWGDDVESFRPERFGEPASNELVNSMRFFGFGGGPRYCIGKSLALAEIRAITTRLLVRYRITTCPTTPEKIDGISPNMIHTIIRHPMDLAFTEISTV